MNIKTLIRALAALVLLLPLWAQAHTALKESTPGAGTTVKVAPTHLDLVFNGPVRLIKLELMGVGHEMPTGFKPQSEAMASYRVETPGMHPGAFTVNWAAIGADGHTLTESFSFTVDPAATEPAEHGHSSEGHQAHGNGH